MHKQQTGKIYKPEIQQILQVLFTSQKKIIPISPSQTEEPHGLLFLERKKNPKDSQKNDPSLRVTKLTLCSKVSGGERLPSSVQLPDISKCKGQVFCSWLHKCTHGVGNSYVKGILMINTDLTRLLPPPIYTFNWADLDLTLGTTDTMTH